MNLNIVHLDDALMEQPDFLSACVKFNAVQSDLRKMGPDLRLWTKERDFTKLRVALAKTMHGLSDAETMVTWMGSGDFHHVSAALVGLRGEATGRELTIVHFDNHPDWVSFRDGLHCGSWIRYVLESGLARRAISIGVSSRDLAWPEFKGAALDLVKAGKLVVFPARPPATRVFGSYGQGAGHIQTGRQIYWKEFEADCHSGLARHIVDLIETGAIYISIDKDVLDHEYAATNWDQGGLTVQILSAWIGYLASCKTVLGLDILGDYSKPEYGSGLASRLCKRAESWIDQPRLEPGRSGFGDTNQKTNLRLLKTLEGALC